MKEDDYCEICGRKLGTKWCLRFVCKKCCIGGKCPWSSSCYLYPGIIRDKDKLLIERNKEKFNPTRREQK